ncbi:MAG: hypothetical protein ACXVB9_17205 [Bdellovibrionota bacterium]
MKIRGLGLLLFLFTSSSAHADFIGNENNRQIEACRAGLQKFLEKVPFQNGILNGKNAGTPCYLRYYNIVENHHGQSVFGGFVLTTFINGGHYFSSMEIGKDRDDNQTGIHSIMHYCPVGTQTVQIDTEYVDPFAPTRQEEAVLKKDAHGRLISARVRTNLADQTCYFE